MSLTSSPSILLCLALVGVPLVACTSGSSDGKTDGTSGGDGDAATTDGVEIGCSGPETTSLRVTQQGVKQLADNPALECGAQDATITVTPYAEGEARPKCGPPTLLKWNGTSCETVYEPSQVGHVRCKGADCSKLFTGALGDDPATVMSACADAFAGCSRGSDPSPASTGDLPAPH